MPCALLENADYPGYLKTILKEIAVGNDENLKACACQLKSPLNGEGCPILDEDGKLGAFPFCIETTTSDPKNIQVVQSIINLKKPYRVGLKLKELMNLYWRVKDFKITGSTITTNNLNCSPPPQPPPFWQKNSFQNSITKNTQNLNSIKNLFCFDSLPETITHTAKGNYSDSQGNSFPILEQNAFIFNLKFKETVYYYESDEKFYPNIEITFLQNYFNGLSIGPWSFISSPPIPSGPCYGQISDLSINGDIFQNQEFGVLIGCGDAPNCQDRGEMSGKINININSYRS